MPKSSGSVAVDCPQCGKTIGRKSDLPRHLRTHAVNKEELMHTCPYLGCTYKTLQRSNLRIHLNVHTREQPHHCPNCPFSSTNPSSLTRHRIQIHSYEPKGMSGGSRRAKSRRRRVLPYTIPGGVPSSSLSPAHDHVGEDSKTTSATHGTELITTRTQVDGAYDTQIPRQQNSPPFSSGLGASATTEAPVAEHSQLPVRNLYVAGTTTQPFSETIVNDGAFDNFYAQFDNWLSDATTVYTSPSLPTPAVQYPVDDTRIPTPTSSSGSPSIDGLSAPASYLSPTVPFTANDELIPNPSIPSPYELQSTTNNVFIPPPASLTLHDLQSTVGSPPSGYEHNSYSSGTMFGPQFDFSQFSSFAMPNMRVGGYTQPQVFHPRVVAGVDQAHQNYLYSTTAYNTPPMSGNFAMQGFQM